MKIPQIKGKNKIRDAAIVLDFKKSRMPYVELAEKYKLTERRILQILSANHAFIRVDKDWEKEKRIARLERWLNDPKNKDTRKDPADILEQLRKEIEGDKPLVDNSQHTHVTYVWETQNSTDTVQPSRIPTGEFESSG